MIKPGWIPPASPFSLVQEHLFPNEWAILVSCVMLNCTRRSQVEGVLPEFLRRWPDAPALLQAPEEEIIGLCRPLGFANRRTVMLRQLAAAYVGPWEHARELPGIGEYGARAWEIFCRGELGDEPPRDHALVLYWLWCTGRQLGNDGG